MRSAEESVFQILQGRMSIEQADILQYYFNAKPYSISVKVRERLR